MFNNNLESQLDALRRMQKKVNKAAVKQIQQFEMPTFPDSFRHFDVKPEKTGVFARYTQNKGLKRFGIFLLVASVVGGLYLCYKKFVKEDYWLDENEDRYDFVDEFSDNAFDFTESGIDELEDALSHAEEAVDKLSDEEPTNEA